jgi:hypothetical protein
MTEEHVSARLRHIGRDLHSKLKEFFENPLDASATPLELLQAALDDLERRAQPAGRGRRTFPYNRVVVRIAQHAADEAAIQAVFRDLGTRLRDRLAELTCEMPASIAATVVLEPAPEPDAPARVRVECFDDDADVTTPAPPGLSQRPALRITVVKGQCAEAEYVFDEPVIAIGRTAEPTDALGLVRYNHVAFLEERDGVNETVGRAHARLQFDTASGHYVLFNESSSNPTSIVRGGRMIRVAPRDPRGVRVQSGDEVRLGRAVLRLAMLNAEC